MDSAVAFRLGAVEQRCRLGARHAAPAGMEEAYTDVQVQVRQSR